MTESLLKLAFELIIMSLFGKFLVPDYLNKISSCETLQMLIIEKQKKKTRTKYVVNLYFFIAYLNRLIGLVGRVFAYGL